MNKVATKARIGEVFRLAEKTGWPISMAPDGSFSVVPYREPQEDGRDPTPPKVKSFIYFFGCADYVKIGISTNPKSRAETMRTGNPHEITTLRVIPGDIKDERRFHRMFAAHHHRDEWFRHEGELKAWLADGVGE